MKTFFFFYLLCFTGISAATDQDQLSLRLAEIDVKCVQVKAAKACYQKASVALLDDTQSKTLIVVFHERLLLSAERNTFIAFFDTNGTYLSCLKSARKAKFPEREELICQLKANILVDRVTQRVIEKTLQI